MIVELTECICVSIVQRWVWDVKRERVSNVVQWKIKNEKRGESGIMVRREQKERKLELRGQHKTQVLSLGCFSRVLSVKPQGFLRGKYSESE